MPQNWKTYSVKSLIEKGIIEKPLDGNHGGTHPKGSDFIDSGIPFVMASDIIRGNVDLINCKFISKEQADKLRKGFAIGGDVLLTHKASIGRTAIVPEIETEYVMLTPQVTYYRVKDQRQLHNGYLRYYFNSPVFQNEINMRAGSGSTRAYIGITDQQQLSITLPPLPEQRAIASILSALDDKIEINLQMNKTLEEMAMTLYKHWFVDFGPFQNGKFVESELGMIPEGWEVKSLDQISEVIDSLHKTPEYTDSGLNMIRVKDIKGGILNQSETLKVSQEVFKEFSKKHQPTFGDIVLSRVGTYGVFSYIGTNEVCCLGQNTVVIVPKIETSLLFAVLTSSEIQKQIEQQVTGSTQKTISLKSIRALKNTIAG